MKYIPLEVRSWEPFFLCTYTYLAQVVFAKYAFFSDPLFCNFNDYNTDPLLIILVQNILVATTNKTVSLSRLPRLSCGVEYFVGDYILRPSDNLPPFLRVILRIPTSRIGAY